MNGVSPLIITLIGPPGAGKGTQAKFLEQKFGIVQISTGAMIRTRENDTDEIGLALRESRLTSAFAPDDVMIRLVQERAAQKDCRNGYILDGFPRTRPQAVALDAMLEKQGHRLQVVQLEIDEALLVERVEGRTTCSGCEASYHVKFKPPLSENCCDICRSTQFYKRPEDNAETMKERLSDFHTKTRPIIDYYTEQKRLMKVNGEGNPEVVFQEILKLIK